MAVVRNITPDDLALSSGIVPAGEEATVADEEFAGRAWPKSTWELVKKPGKGYRHDSAVTDAHVFHPADAEEAPATSEETV